MPAHHYYVRRTLELLKARGPLTGSYLQDQIGLSKQSTNRLLAELKLLGDIHVARWTLQSSKSLVREFAIGRGEDAIKPASNAELVTRLLAGDKTVYAPAKMIAEINAAAVRNAERRERYNYLQRLKTAQERATRSVYGCIWQGPILTQFVGGKNIWEQGAQT